MHSQAFCSAVWVHYKLVLDKTYDGNNSFNQGYVSFTFSDLLSEGHFQMYITFQLSFSTAFGSCSLVTVFLLIDFS